MPRLGVLWRENAQLCVGLGVILAVVLFGLLGPLLVDTRGARVGSAMPDQPPSAQYLLGTDSVGREILPVVIAGTPLTFEIGLVAGTIGLGVGIVFGFVAGYYGGLWDTLLRGAADVFLTVPSLLILVVIASTLRGAVDVTTEALVVSALAWMWPTRTIRSQVLTMRERGYVQVARLSGMSGAKIIFQEMMPNLLPYLAASFVGAVATAILASIGLEALGLGPQNEPTLGMTIYWALYYTSVVRGLVWWWASPIVVIVMIFTGLFLIAAGLDQIANPRLRKVA
ncbi:MAG TPA: ABC transporter permease [Chloroflexota bacterium]|jgi:peptide/nickel transport system permease protein|nr:ABC transporter permease [Chloroflexota bacterium]